MLHTPTAAGRDDNPAGFRSFDLVGNEHHIRGPGTAATAFLIPGALGDDPPLENFRRCLAERLRLELVDMPDIGWPGSVLASMEATARVIAAEIVRRSPSGDISLVGFSFGGSVALEVASQLTCAGRHVACLAILDAPFKGNDMRDGYSAHVGPVDKARAIMKSVKSAAGTETRRLIATAASADQERLGKSQMIRKALLRHLRSKALGTWVPPSSQARGLLLWTGEMGGHANLARWQQLCPNLQLVVVSADHPKLLEGASREAVAAALAAAMSQHAGPELEVAPVDVDPASSSAGPGREDPI